MPTTRTVSPTVSSTTWTTDMRDSVIEPFETPLSNSNLADTSPLAQRRHAVTPSHLAPSTRSAGGEEQDEIASFSHSPVSAVPPSPSGLLLFRRRSSALVDRREECSTIPILSFDSPHDVLEFSSRRSSDSSSSSALDPSSSGSSNRRTSWSSALAGDRSTGRPSSSSHFLPPPSSASAFFSTSLVGTRSTQLLSPIEASPLISSSLDSTPRTTPDSSIELLHTPRFSSSSSFGESPYPSHDSFKDSSVRRRSYSAITVDSARLPSPAHPSSPCLGSSPVLGSTRTIRRNLRRFLVLASTVVIVLCLAKQNRLAHLPSFTQIRSLYFDNHIESAVDYDVYPHSAIEQHAQARNESMIIHEEEDLEDEGTASVVDKTDYPVREEIKEFREEQLWMAPKEMLETRVVEPREGFQHESTIIMIHGLSQSVQQNSWLHQQLASQLPSARWVMPQAPKLPITYHDKEERPAWFDIAKFPWNGIEESDEEHLLSSTRALNQIIRDERDRLIHSRRKQQNDESPRPGTNEEREWATKRIVVGGFSQGGVMSLLAGITNEERLGGVFVVSGMLAMRDLLPELVRDLNRSDLPIWWGHGEVDPYLLVSDATSAVESLRSPTPGLGLSRVTYQTYPGLSHTWIHREVDDLLKWMTTELEVPLVAEVKPHKMSKVRRRR